LCQDGMGTQYRQKKHDSHIYDGKTHWKEIMSLNCLE